MSNISSSATITGSTVKTNTLQAKTSGGAITVESDIRAERNHVAARSVHAQGIYYHNESGLGAKIIDSRGNVTARSVTAIEAMNARRFIGIGALKACALCYTEKISGEHDNDPATVYAATVKEGFGIEGDGEDYKVITGSPKFGFYLVKDGMGSYNFKKLNFDGDKFSGSSFKTSPGTYVIVFY